MKFTFVGIGICAAVAVLSAQMPKYGVTVMAEKNVDFGKFSTYSWTPGQPSANKMIDSFITTAVERELDALGMTRKAAGHADVLATYYSVSRTDVDLKAKPKADGRLPEHWVGTLVVALLEPESRRRLLRLRIDQPIDTDPAMLEASINGAVAELFAKYPTRAR